MKLGRFVSHAVKLCSRRYKYMWFSKRVLTCNFENSYRTESTAPTGLASRKEYFKEKDLTLLYKRNIEEFDAIFPLVVDSLINDNDVQDKNIKDVFIRFKKILETNVPNGKKNRGLTVVISYKLLANPKDLIEENIKLAHILGWCIEIMQAFFVILDDVMDQSFTRRGMECWFRNENVGLMAINDAIMLESGIFYLLKKYFKNLPCYLNIMETFQQIIRLTSFGQCLDLLSEPSIYNLKFDAFTEDNYATIVKYKTAYYSFILPVKLALYLAGWTNENHHKEAEQVLLKMGHFFQVQDDYLDCFGDPLIMGKQGTDIEDGKCSWVIVSALKIASEEQKAILIENYGLHEESSVRKVKEIYNELGIQNLYSQFEDKTFQELTVLINNITKFSDLPAEIFHSLMKVLYKRNK